MQQSFGRGVLPTEHVGCGAGIVLTGPVPGGEGAGAEEPFETVAHVEIGSRIVNRHGVVGIPLRLLPGIEYDFVPSLVGMDGGDDSPDGVVEEHATDALDHIEFVLIRGGEEGLVLTNRASLVVLDYPTRAHPAG